MTATLITDHTVAPVSTASGGPSERAFSRFLAGLHGHVVLPGSPTWDQARRSWNLGYDPQPMAVVRAADAADVSATVRFAREHDVPLTIRSGGHTGSVGLGGLVTGGGIGWLTRAYGMTIDSLVAADMVTADGEQLTVDADHHPDLFWGIRGGGGNLGIATRFTLRLHPVERFLGGAIALPATVEVVRSLLEVADAAPDGLTLIPALMRIPPLPFVPAEYHGAPSLMVLIAWVGDLEAGQRALASVRAIAPAMADMVAPMPYPAIYSMTEEAGTPTVDSSRSAFLGELDDAAIAGFIEGIETSTAEMTLIQLRVLGRAMARVPAEATAFAHRSARIMAVVIAADPDPETHVANEAWAIRMHGLIAPRATGVYANFLHREGPERVREAYPGATYERLVALKRQWDPTNLFRYNQNIQP